MMNHLVLSGLRQYKMLIVILNELNEFSKSENKNKMYTPIYPGLSIETNLCYANTYGNDNKHYDNKWLLKTCLLVNLYIFDFLGVPKCGLVKADTGATLDVTKITGPSLLFQTDSPRLLFW